MGNTRNTGYLQNIVQYDASNNIILPSLTGIGTRMVVSSSTGLLSTQEILTYVSQIQHQVKLGATMSAGTAVYVSGSTGGSGTNMIVSKASNASEATSSKTLGLTKTGGVTNDEVFVITEGLLAGLDTSTANAGDPVWLGVDGALIFGLLNKPTAPAHLVFIGVVTRVQSNNGEIFVKVQNGFELDELHNLSVASPSDGDMIKYVASTGLWTKTAASTTNITEGTNLYYTNARARLAISLTTTGTSGAATYDNTTGVLNIPQYQGGVTSFNTRTGAVTLSSGDVTTALGYTPVTNARTLTINGTTYDLSANRSWTIAPDTSVRNIYTFTATAAQTTFTVTGGYTVGLIDVFINGVKLASTDFTATNGTTVVLATGTGVGNIVEIVKYVSAFTTAVENIRTLTINGVTYDLSENRTWSITNASLGAQPQLNGTGLVRMSGTTVSYDNATYATQSYVTTAIANLVDSAPGTLDTLNELAAALGDDPNFATTVATSIGTKLPLAGGTLTGALAGTTATFSGNIRKTGSIGVNTELQSDGIYATGTDLYLLAPSTKSIIFYSNNVPAMLLNASGNLSIGNTNDTYKLDVSGTSRFAASYTASGSVAIQTWQRVGGAVSADMTYNDANTSMNFGTSTSHTLNIKTNNTTALTIASTGVATFSNIVNIGYDSNNRSTIRLTSNAANRQAAIYFYGNNVESAALGYEGGSEVVGGGIQGDFVIRNVLANKHIILTTNNGNVAIGRTNPEFTLDVNGDIAFNRTNKLMFAGPVVGDRSRSYLTGDGNNNIFLYGPSGNLTVTFEYTSAVVFTSSVTASDIFLNKSSDGIFARLGGNTPKISLYQFSAGNVMNYGHNFYYDGSNYGKNNLALQGWQIRSHITNGLFSVFFSPAGTLTQNEIVVVDGANQRLAIGNSGPLTKLHVNNAVSGAILPYINGTGLSYNNDGISVAGSNTNNTNIGNGITFYNNVASVGAYGPVISWSSMTVGGAYNATYAFITGVYRGAGGDNNWSTGEIIFGTGNAYGASERMAIKNTGQIVTYNGQTGGYIRRDSGYVNETATITENRTAYFLYKYSGDANGSSSTTFNITGLSTTNGTWADINIRVRKDATGSAINTVGYIQINGQDMIGGVFASGTAAVQTNRTIRVVRMSDEWIIIGAVGSY